jgi:lipid II:glycine glycyltransferase (peptidoglycan interpeptide bridge formation enzyme)
MEELKKRHVKTYDLGGIVSLDVSEEDSTYGVYKFKKGFGGTPTKIATEYVYRRFKFI